MSEEEACDICDGGQSSKKNPIIFCDGESCNLPVHKVCYKVDEIPEDDWYCQRCVAKKRKKTINIICCPKQTGALKQTIVSDSYMHVVCAMWNKSIKDDMEPYSFNKKQLDLQECYICSKKKGICIECEDPSCSTRFHATCAINNGLIVPARTVSADYSPKCGQHQPKPKPKPKRQKRRVIRRRKEISSSEEEEEEESEHEEEDEEENGADDSENDDEEEEEEEEEEESDEEMGNKNKTTTTSSSSGSSNNKKGNKPATTINTTTTTTTTATTMSVTNSGTKRKEPATPNKQDKKPLEKKRSPHALFAKDQITTDEDEDDEDDDDDMGTRSSTPSKLKRFRIENESSINSNNGTSTQTISTKSNPAGPQPLYNRDRFDPKRKKTNTTDTKTVFKLDLEKTPSLTSANISSSTSSSSSPKNTPTIAPVPTKQKLPNKAHLGTSKPTQQRPPSMTPPIKKFSGANQLDIDAITNTMSNSQRWNNNNNNSGVHTQPTTPHSVSTSFFDNDNNNNIRMSSTPRNSIDAWGSNVEREEVMRLREEVHKLNEFKRAVTEIFSTLKIQVPGGNAPAENIEGFISELQSLLRRVGPMRDEDDAYVKECVETVMTKK